MAASLRERFGVEAAAIQADVSSFDAAAGLMQAAREKLGEVSVLVNNAGITRDALFLRMKEDDFDRVVAVNLKGAFNCCKAVVPAMCKAAPRPHREHVEHFGLAWQRGPGELCRVEGGHRGPYKSLARGSEAARRNRERGGSRLHRDRHDRCRSREGEGIGARQHS